MSSAAEILATPPIPKPPAALSPRSFVPLVASMFAVFAALLAQQTVIDAAARWRDR